jgi:hypothetical protein
LVWEETKALTWTFYPDRYQYRDDDTGRFADKRDVWKWSDACMDEQADQAKGLATALAGDTLTVGEWEADMRRRIKAEYTRQYLLGRGGRSAMTDEDWGSVGGMIADQYRYLDGFAAEIAAGELSEKMIAARSAMYLQSAREAFNRAQTRGRGIPIGALDAYPGDGASCLGLTNCGCNLDFHKHGNAWRVYWILNPAKENCELCIQHAAEWAPFVVEIEES